MYQGKVFIYSFYPEQLNEMKYFRATLNIIYLQAEVIMVSGPVLVNYLMFDPGPDHCC